MLRSRATVVAPCSYCCCQGSPEGEQDGVGGGSEVVRPEEGPPKVAELRRKLSHQLPTGCHQVYTLARPPPQATLETSLSSKDSVKNTTPAPCCVKQEIKPFWRSAHSTGEGLET